ncbi:MAG: putative addiction module antidote protein [Campylobacteraceae bacterium]|jgi:probable addiction module antidote protein|nr:putative addiction module antidote protein [Campylobacteraceae bacterium]
MSKYKYITPEDAELTPYKVDIVKYLTDDESIEFYLNLVLEDGDEAEFKRALGYIAKAKGMTAVAKDINVSRESLYKSLNGQRSVGIDTVFKLLKNLGITLSAKVSRA